MYANSPPPRTIGSFVDDYGYLMSKLAVMQEQLEQYKQRFKEYGPGAYEGELFRVTVSESERSRTDYKAICAKLQPSRQLVAAHTSKVPVVQVACKARKGVDRVV